MAGLITNVPFGPLPAGLEMEGALSSLDVAEDFLLVEETFLWPPPPPPCPSLSFPGTESLPLERDALRVAAAPAVGEWRSPEALVRLPRWGGTSLLRLTALADEEDVAW